MPAMTNDGHLKTVGLRHMPGSRVIAISIAVFLGAGFFLLTAADTEAQNGGELRPPNAFAGITDPQARSRALFTEATKVIMSPRCVNCHPAGDRPLQGNDQHLHKPFVPRGDTGMGIAGNTCQACHTDRNFPVGDGASYQSIPGHPRWALAPIEMAWQGKSAREICGQLKDRNRNGGRDLAQLHEHLAKDDLIAWGWNPGVGREPVPGTQARLGELVQAWIDTGAQCP
jgi:mono/diheme cytochrome c family protein